MLESQRQRADTQPCAGTEQQNFIAALDAPVQIELPLTQCHPLIRQGDDYADLFTLGAKQSANLTPIQEGVSP